MSRARDIANYGDGIDTSSITSGTFADARIASSNVTQHEGSIDALNFSGISNDAISGDKIHGGVPSNLLYLGLDWDNPWGAGNGVSQGSGAWSTLYYTKRNYVSVSGTPDIDLSSTDFPHGLYIINVRVGWDGSGFNLWSFISKNKYANNTQYGFPNTGGGYLMKGAYYEIQNSGQAIQARFNASWVNANTPNWTLWQLIDYEGV